jgi:hypothetical protein
MHNEHDDRACHQASLRLSGRNVGVRASGNRSRRARAKALQPTVNVYHEAGHGVAGVALGAHPLTRIVVFEDGAEPSDVDGSVIGGRAHFGEGVRDPDRPQHICPCWRIKLMDGALTCAGPAAERKLRLAERLPQLSLLGAGHDREDMRALARAVWLGAGRDGFAFERLAWKTAQRIVDEPPLWAAIAALAQVVLAQPVQNGERVLQGERVKEIMRDRGVEPGALREAFFARCFSPACACSPPKRRKVSRRFVPFAAWWTLDYEEELSNAAALCHPCVTLERDQV